MTIARADTSPTKEETKATETVSGHRPVVTDTSASPLSSGQLSSPAVEVEARTTDLEACESRTTVPAKMSPKHGIFGRTWAYQAVSITLKAIWLITPLSIAGLGGSLFFLVTNRSVTPLPMIASILCTAELVSAVYQRFLIRRARRQIPGLAMPLEEWAGWGHKVFHSDLRTERKDDGRLEVIVVDEVEAEEKTENVAPRLKRADSTSSEISCSSMCCSGDTSHDLSPEGQARAMSFRKRYGIWFNDARWEDLRRDDVLIWLAGIILNITLDQARQDPASMSLLLKLYVIVESRSATMFPPGRNPQVRVTRMCLDPLNAIPRPLVIYLINNGVNLGLRHIYLPLRGMSRYRQGDIDYMLRIPPGWTPEAGRSDPNAMPLMYLHGMGFGLIQNVKTVKPLLDRFKTHPVLLPIAHHTAQSFFHSAHLRPWTRKQFVQDMKAICERWGFVQGVGAGKEGNHAGGLSVMSHSNGSVHHGWLLKDCPQLVRRNTFVDPVIFCLDEGFTCHAFCYRAPTTKLVSSELGISNYIQRHFHWSDNNLYIDDHPTLLDPAKTQFFLGKKDVIVDALRVKEYLESQGVKVGVNLTWDEDGGHSKALEGDSLPRVQGFIATGVRDWT